MSGKTSISKDLMVLADDFCSFNEDLAFLCSAIGGMMIHWNDGEGSTPEIRGLFKVTGNLKSQSNAFNMRIHALYEEAHAIDSQDSP